MPHRFRVFPIRSEKLRLPYPKVGQEPPPPFPSVHLQFITHDHLYAISPMRLRDVLK